MGVSWAIGAWRHVKVSQPPGSHMLPSSQSFGPAHPPPPASAAALTTAHVVTSHVAPLCRGGAHAAIASCPAATAPSSQLRKLAMSGGDVLDGRAGNGKQSAGRDQGLAWLRVHKLEKAEDPVDLREIGTGKVHVK